MGVYAVLGDSRKDYVRTGWEKSKKVKSKVTQKTQEKQSRECGGSGVGGAPFTSPLGPNQKPIL